MCAVSALRSLVAFHLRCALFAGCTGPLHVRLLLSSSVESAPPAPSVLPVWPEVAASDDPRDLNILLKTRPTELKRPPNGIISGATRRRIASSGLGLDAGRSGVWASTSEIVDGFAVACTGVDVVGAEGNDETGRLDAWEAGRSVEVEDSDDDVNVPYACAPGARTNC